MLFAWVNVEVQREPLSDFHVIPAADLRDHQPAMKCWCCPREDEDQPRVWIHTALDGRETHEAGAPLH